MIQSLFLRERIAPIPQHYTCTLHDYREEYECLSISLPPIQNIIMEQTFIKGLKLELHAKISKENLTRLRAIMDATLYVEKRLNVMW